MILSADDTLHSLWAGRLRGEGDLRGVFSSGVLHRGRKYLRLGRVSRLHFGESEIRAEVNGTSLYTTALSWRNGHVEYHCTCPFGAGCKHAAALLLKAQQETVTGAAPARAVARQQNGPATAVPAQTAPAPPPATRPDLFRLLETPTPADVRRKVWIAVSPDFTRQKFELQFLMDSVRLRKSPRPLYDLLNMTRRDLQPWAQPEWDEQDRALLLLVSQLPTDAAHWWTSYHSKTVGAQSFSTLLLAAATFPRLLLRPVGCVLAAEAAEEWKPLRVSLEPLRVEFDGTWQPDSTTLRARFLRADGTEVPAQELGAVEASPRWWFDGQTFFLHDNSFHPDLRTEAARGARFRLEGPAALRLLERADVRSRFSPALAAACPVLELAPAVPALYLDLDATTDRLLLRALLRNQEHGLEWTAGPPEAVYLPHPMDSARLLSCPPEARERLHEQVAQDGFRPVGPGNYVLEGSSEIAEFVFTRLPEWMQREQVFASDAVRGMLEGGRPAQFKVNITPSGLDWFELDVRFFDNEEELDTSAIWEAIRQGRRYVRLRGARGDRVVVLDGETMSRLRRELDDLADAGSHRYRCSPFLLYSAVEGLRTLGAVELSPEAQSFYERVRTFRGIRSVEPPAELAPVLRPYQREGLAYLHYLEEMNFGGVLADDMGLGKTLQVLAYLENLRRARGPAPNLVICPTSVGHNWISEAQRFTPQMRTLLLERGAGRHRHLTRLGDYDLVVTSYALLRRDLERLKLFRFRTLILDEAQNIKNPQTLAAGCARQLQAERRLALTGTPLENSVLDLWSIYHFVLPGLLGTMAQFQERFQGPIEQEAIPEVRARLSRRLRPFLLRRLKGDVAPELPPRVEQTVECDLTPAQRQLYRETALQARGEVMQAVRERGLAQSQIHILAALMRLRQICCHPLLLAGRLDPKRVQRRMENVSGKMNAFVELLDTLLEGGHRILVFSQFTQMLAILRGHLESRGIAYGYLDGATLRRKEEIERFQEDEARKVFLLSLKAGGTGVNLTAADYVILYDPWWNPAVENQAIDRTHRIGQTRTVVAYRMVTRGTVEEKILKLQARKAELVRAVVESDTTFAKHLTVDDLEELFRAE